MNQSTSRRASIEYGIFGWTLPCTNMPSRAYPSTGRELTEYSLYYHLHAVIRQVSPAVGSPVGCGLDTKEHPADFSKIPTPLFGNAPPQDPTNLSYHARGGLRCVTIHPGRGINADIDYNFLGGVVGRRNETKKGLCGLQLYRVQ